MTDRDDPARPERTGPTYLILSEQPRIDYDRWIELVVGLGEAKARTQMASTIGKLGPLQDDLFRALQAGQMLRVSALAEDVIRLARASGLASCAMIGRDLQHCAKTGDTVAAGAVLHRLARHCSGSARSCRELAEPLG
jgi:hypothetical protein